MCRKFLSLALALCLMLLPMTALAVDGTILPDWVVTEVVPTSRYEDTGSFYNYPAKVKQNGKWGLIDEAGEEIVPCKYDNIYTIGSGLLQVTLGDKQGILDKAGVEIVPCKYSYIGDFSGDLARVCVGDSSSRKYGFIDRAGREVIPCKYDMAESFSDGLAKVEINDNWGYINTVGDEIVPCKYRRLGNFSEDLAPAMWPGDTWWDFGYIDKSGRVVFSCSDYGGSFSDGLARIELSGKYGFIDRTGKQVVPCKYDHAWDFDHGLAVVSLNGKWGVIDSTGKEIVPCQYYTVVIMSGSLVEVCLDGDKYGVIDKTGREIVPCQYDSVSFNEDHSLVMTHLDSGDWSMFDRTGKTVASSEKYEYAEFIDDLVCVVQNGKWGLIDKSGRAVTTCKYDFDFGVLGEGWLSFTDDGLARVALDGKWGYINTTGQEVVPCKYEQAAFWFRDGVAWVKLNGKWGLIDATGREISPFKYDDDCYEDGTDGVAEYLLGNHDFNGNSFACVTQNGKYGMIDRTGTEVVPCEYSHVFNVSEDGIAVVALNGNTGIVDVASARFIPFEKNYGSQYDPLSNGFWQVTTDEAMVGLISVTRADKSGVLEGDSGKSVAWSASAKGEVKVDKVSLGQNEKVLVGCYDNKGRFIGVKPLDAQNAAAQIDPTVPNVKLFWLGARQEPLSLSETVWGR